MSADGVIFNNVYDNGYSNNQVIFSLRDDLKNGRVFKKGAKPLEKSQFIDTGTSMNGDLDINKNIQNFVEYLLNPETQQRIASIDAELGTKYGEAAKRFVDRYNNGNLTVLPRNKRDVGLDNDIIKFSRSVPSENNGLRNLRLLFNYIIKDKNEFMRRFNKYGFGVVPATTIINNYDNE